MCLDVLAIENAYDRVDRDRLWEVLRGVGYRQKIVNIKSLYNETRTYFTFLNIETDSVRSRRRIRPWPDNFRVDGPVSVGLELINMKW